VTLTIGLINVNFLVDTLFASRLLDPEPRRRRSARHSGCTCSRGHFASR
jgi:hypothetical protein